MTGDNVVERGADRLVLYRSWRQALFGVLPACALLLTTVASLLTTDGERELPDAVVVTTWAGVAFFTLVVIASVLPLVSRRPVLVADRDGFRDATSLRRSRWVAWAQVATLEIGTTLWHRYLLVRGRDGKRLAMVSQGLVPVALDELRQELSRLRGEPASSGRGGVTVVAPAKSGVGGSRVTFAFTVYWLTDFVLGRGFGLTEPARFGLAVVLVVLVDLLFEVDGIAGRISRRRR